MNEIAVALYMLTGVITFSAIIMHKCIGSAYEIDSIMYADRAILWAFLIVCAYKLYKG